jgi:hypothetical protein
MIGRIDERQGFQADVRFFWVVARHYADGGRPTSRPPVTNRPLRPPKPGSIATDLRTTHIELFIIHREGS